MNRSAMAIVMAAAAGASLGGAECPGPGIRCRTESAEAPDREVL